MRTRTVNQVVTRPIANKDRMYFTITDIVDVNISDSNDHSVAIMITITITITIHTSTFHLNYTMLSLLSRIRVIQSDGE